MDKPSYLSEKQYQLFLKTRSFLQENGASGNDVIKVSMYMNFMVTEPALRDLI